MHISLSKLEINQSSVGLGNTKSNRITLKRTSTDLAIRLYFYIFK